MAFCKVNSPVLSTFACVAVFVQFTCQYTSGNGLTPKVLLTNNGPTIRGATTTFTAELSFINETVGPSPPNRMETARGVGTQPYVYYWKQFVCGNFKVTKMEQGSSCNLTQTYTCAEDIGLHRVTVEVRKNDFILKPFLVSNATSFQITEHINANLSVKQGVSCNSTYGIENCNVVATNKSVDMVVNIHDPSNFFQGATLLYHWTFGDGAADTTINQPTVSHKYKKPGHYGIAVNMTALFPNDAGPSRPPKTGNVKQNLDTMDAVKNLTIQGNNNLEAGHKASYNISCHASLPMEYCWYVIRTTTEQVDNAFSDSVACNRIVLTNRTWYELCHWFNITGGYSIGVRAQNAVSSTDANKNLHVYAKSMNAVVGLVVGIFFGIAGCILCIAVITNHMRRQKSRHVEVANFDFQSRSQRRRTLGSRVRNLFSSGSQEEMLALSQDFNQNRKV